MSESVLLQGDCLELMKDIPDKSIDLILTDPPYGTTACKWDSIIPFEPMWAELKRVIKPNSAIILFGSEPFSSHLRVSNINMFRYDWVWEKEAASNIFNKAKMPGALLENISVFSVCNPKSINYYPLKTMRKKPIKITSTFPDEKHRDKTNKWESKSFTRISDSTYPNNLLRFNRERTKLHPTQKPVALLEYLIKTYTLEGETVLDFTMGSGSTGVACKNLGRKFIGIEKDENYFKIAEKRISETGEK